MPTLKKKTIISKISASIVILNYALLVFALIAHKIALGSKGAELNFWHNTIWDNLSRFLTLIPLIFALPFTIFNIVGMVIEKRVLPFLFYIILPVIAWIIIALVTAAYL